LPDRWKWTLASGLLAVILGILVLAWPGISILVAATFVSQDHRQQPGGQRPFPQARQQPWGLAIVMADSQELSATAFARA